MAATQPPPNRCLLASASCSSTPSLVSSGPSLSVTSSPRAKSIPTHQRPSRHPFQTDEGECKFTGETTPRSSAPSLSSDRASVFDGEFRPLGLLASPGAPSCTAAAAVSGVASIVIEDVVLRMPRRPTFPNPQKHRKQTQQPLHLEFRADGFVALTNKLIPIMQENDSPDSGGVVPWDSTPMMFVKWTGPWEIPLPPLALDGKKSEFKMEIIVKTRAPFDSGHVLDVLLLDLLRIHMESLRHFEAVLKAGTLILNFRKKGDHSPSLPGGAPQPLHPHIITTHMGDPSSLLHPNLAAFQSPDREGVEGSNPTTLFVSPNPFVETSRPLPLPPLPTSHIPSNQQGFGRKVLRLFYCCGCWHRNRIVAGAINAEQSSFSGPSALQSSSE